MRQLAPNLWVRECPLRFGGLEVGARMTVVRLPDEKLWVLSPIRVSPELLGEVEALGPVAYLVAPNRLHHLFMADWQKAFPDAAAYLAPGLESKRKDLRYDGLLSDEAEPGWKGTIEQVVVQGFPFANEVAFYHAPTTTLVLTDLAFNIGTNTKLPWLTRKAFGLIGTAGEVAPTLLEKLLVRDRPAFRSSLDRILEWPFERIIVAHGDVSELGGREELVRGYAWLPAAAAK